MDSLMSLLSFPRLRDMSTLAEGASTMVFDFTDWIIIVLLVADWLLAFNPTLDSS